MFVYCLKQIKPYHVTITINDTNHDTNIKLLCNFLCLLNRRYYVLFIFLLVTFSVWLKKLSTYVHKNAIFS